MGCFAVTPNNTCGAPVPSSIWCDHRHSRSVCSMRVEAYDEVISDGWDRANIRVARYPLRVPSSTRTRYAKAGDVDIAYQVLGDGPIDLLMCTGVVIPIDCMDEEPSIARFQRRLTSFARLVRFDIRGVG